MTVAQINLIPFMPAATQGVGKAAPTWKEGQPVANGTGWAEVAQPRSAGPLQVAANPQSREKRSGDAGASAELLALLSAGGTADGITATTTGEGGGKPPALGFAASMIDQLLKQTSDPSASSTDAPEGITAAMAATDAFTDDSGQHPAELAPSDIPSAAQRPAAVLPAIQSATPEAVPFSISSVATRPTAVLSGTQNGTPEAAPFNISSAAMPAPSAAGTLTPPVGGQALPAGVQTTDPVAPAEGGPKGEPQVSSPVQTPAQSVQPSASDASVVSGDRPVILAQSALVGVTPGLPAEEPALRPTWAQRGQARPGRLDAPSENMSKVGDIAARVAGSATTPGGDFNVRVSAVRATLNESSPSNNSPGDAADQPAVQVGIAQPPPVGPAPAASVSELQAARQPVEAEENASLADQVAQSLRGTLERGGRSITLRLNPPELGKVRMSLQAEGRELRGGLEADNVRTLG